MTAIIAELFIAGQYVIWEQAVTRDGVRNFSIESCNWKTGEVVSVRTSPLSAQAYHH